MNKNKTYYLFIIILLTGFTACKKELSNRDSFEAYQNNPLNDTSWTEKIFLGSNFKDLIFESTYIAPFTDTINIDSTSTSVLPDNTELIFSKSSFRNADGSLVNGKINMVVHSLNKKGDLVKLMQSTAYKRTIFESIGTFYIKAYKDNNELFLVRDSTVKIRFNDSKRDKRANIKLCSGIENLMPQPTKNHHFNFSWFESDNEIGIKKWDRQNSSGNSIKGYEVTSNKLNWISAIEPIDSSNELEGFAVVLPPNFTNNNTIVYAVLEDNNTAVQLIPSYNSKAFISDHFPSNKKVTLLSITKIGKDFYFGKIYLNEIDDKKIYKLNPEKTTLKYISDFLNGL
jgi:hypothetical protein